MIKILFRFFAVILFVFFFSTVASAKIPAIISVLLDEPESGSNADFQARTAIQLSPTFSDVLVDWSLRESGQLYFKAFKQPGDVLGLYTTGGAGGFQAIIESGDSAPELPGLTVSLAGGLVAQDNGYAFSVFLIGPGVTTANDIAFYAGTQSSGPRLVLREGDEVPGLAGNFFDFGVDKIRVNSNGTTFFQVNIRGGSDSAALIVDSGTGPTVVATGSATGLMSPVINNQGNIGCIWFTDGEWSVWSGPPSAIQQRLTVGDSAPGTGSSFAEFDTVSWGSSSQLALSATLANGFNAIYSGLGLSTNLVHISADSLPGRVMTADTASRVAFIESFASTGKLYAEQDDPNPLLIAELGQLAPGMPAGVVFFDFRGAAMINPSGQVAFTAVLSGTGVTGSNDLSLWIYDPTLGLTAVAREGSTIQISPSSTKTIQGIIPSFGNSLQDGAGKTFNSNGELAFLATFTDNSSALLVVQTQTRPIVVTPASFLVTRGFYVSGDETSLAASDNVDLALQRLGADVQSRTEFEVVGTSPTASPASFEVTLEGAVFARSQVDQTIELWDYVLGAWELVDASVATNIIDSTVTAAGTGDLSRFVDQTTLEVKARIHFQSLSPRQRFASNTDQFIWMIGE